jgi:hypothetical protein
MDDAGGGSEALALDEVVAPLNYLVADGPRPATYMYEPPAGVPRQSGAYALHPVAIRNGRKRRDRLSLDVEGLGLVDHDTAVTDFSDERQIAAIYYPEMERLLTELTGADKVVVFDHTRRGGSLPPEAKQGLRDPVRRVHNDYTPKSGPQRVRDLLPPDEARERLKHRYAIINVWRPVRGPLEEAPLALCDARSVAPADLVGNDQIYRDRIGETYTVAFSPNHRWYYFPRMQTNEVALIKSYDSATDGTARFAPHSAFDDPTMRVGALPRESIEIRALVFYPPA